MSGSGEPVLPDYGAGGLACVLPSLLASLGAPAVGPVRELPPARAAVVVLVDGLGLELLRRRGGHAPFLRSLMPAALPLTSGFPSTTATSMGTFGTGLPPGAHGLLGTLVRDPGTDALVDELGWKRLDAAGESPGPEPQAWQPHPTVFEQAAAAGVGVTHIGPHRFDGSGLTTAALRGGGFHGSGRLGSSVDAAVQAARRPGAQLVYLYWGQLDKVGHVHGCGSWQWGEELEAVDAAVRELAGRLPDDASLTVTADHGMVDAPHDARLDLAHEPDLQAGVHLVAGEARCLQLHTRPGARDDVVAAWRERLGERAWVVDRAEMVRRGWVGAVDPLAPALQRAGDVIVAMRGDLAVVDSRTMRPVVVGLLGVHGSLTADEVLVPLLHRPTRSQR